MRLKEIRKEKGLTTYDVGEALGVSPSAITNWETGFRRPDIDTLVKLAEVLGCTPNDLLGFETHRTEEPACRAQ